jgi:hypothetical protein
MTTRSLTARYFATAADLRAAVRGALVGLRGLDGVAPDEDDADHEMDEGARDDTAAVIVWNSDARSYEMLGDVSGAEYDDRADALDAVTETEWFRDAFARKHKPSDLAEPRWFDAAAEEDMPSYRDGSQVAEHMIDDMVRNLAAERTPITIDGGGVSEVHSSVYDSGVPAAGYGYVGVKLIDEDGRAHLYLYGACLPEVDQRIDKKQMQWGSIAFVADDTHRYSADGEPVAIGARLISYALTNQPFIDGLEPHASRSKADPSGRRFAITRSRKTMATKKPVRSNEVPPTQPAATDVRDAAPAVAPVADQRAEDMPGEDAGAAAFANDVTAELRRIMGMGEDVSPAALLEALKAMADGVMAGEEPVDENAAEGGQPVAASAAEGTRSAEIRAEAIGLRSRVADLESEIGKYREAAKRVELERHLDGQCAVIKRALPPAQRTELLDMAMQHGGDAKRLLDITVRALNVPPQGVALGQAPAPLTAGASGGGASKRDFLAAIREELKKSEPGLSRDALRTRTYAVAKQRNPALIASDD